MRLGGRPRTRTEDGSLRPSRVGDRAATPGGTVGAHYTCTALARRVVAWAGIQASARRIIDMGAGDGALTIAIMRHVQRAPHATVGCACAKCQPIDVVAVERDIRCSYMLGLTGARIVIDDVLQCVLPTADLVVSNPPFEDDVWWRFILRALALAPRAVVIGPLNMLAGLERWQTLWGDHGIQLARLAICARRPPFDLLEGSSGKRDIAVYDIVRSSQRIATQIEWWPDEWVAA